MNDYQNVYNQLVTMRHCFLSLKEFLNFLPLVSSEEDIDISDMLSQLRNLQSQFFTAFDSAYSSVVRCEFPSISKESGV